MVADTWSLPSRTLTVKTVIETRLHDVFVRHMSSRRDNLRSMPKEVTMAPSKPQEEGQPQVDAVPAPMVQQGVEPSPRVTMTWISTGESNPAACRRLLRILFAPAEPDDDGRELH